MKHKVRLWSGIGILAALGFLTAAAFSLPADEPKEPGKDGYVGSAKCADCHEKETKSFQSNAHGVLENKKSPAGKLGCETCHGPGKTHAGDKDQPGQPSVVTFGRKGNKSTADQNATCLQCHSYGKTSRWHLSAHEKRGVGCSDCHKVHEGHDKNLVRKTQTDTCLGCHKERRADLHRISRHPIEDGKLSCTSCHNPHGSTGEKMLTGNTVNETCFQCHAEKRGPFLHEHAPVTENCLTCHKPHASTYEKLLTLRKPLLCQQCHSNPRHPGTIYARRQDQIGQPLYGVQTGRLFGMSCSNCHMQIHGTNHPAGKMLNR